MRPSLQHRAENSDSSDLDTPHRLGKGRGDRVYPYTAAHVKLVDMKRVKVKVFINACESCYRPTSCVMEDGVRLQYMVPLQLGPGPLRSRIPQ